MPVLAPGDWWERVLPWRKNARLLKHEQGLASYQRDHHLWEAARSLQLADWERRRRRSEVERFTSVDVMHELLAEALGNVAWPRETSVNAEISPNLLTLCTEVDLPEIEDLPTTEAVVAERGLKLNLHERSAAQIRKAYAIHIHGIIFRVIGESFSTLPTLTTIISSGFSQRPDADSGHVRDEYLLSVRVSRDQWAGLDFSNLSQVDPVAALARFALRSECTASGRMSPIVPWPATA